LDSNLFKALVASESGFKPNALANRKNPKSARGLTQITDETRKILADERGELRDHYLTATRAQMNDPNVNICAGVRWLFHKRHLASSKLGRAASWEEAVAEYKSIREDLEGGDARAHELMDRFDKHLRAYRKCGK
jgi:soluble lytic murein transglycosylase-like protein